MKTKKKKKTSGVSCAIMNERNEKAIEGSDEKRNKSNQTVCGSDISLWRKITSRVHPLLCKLKFRSSPSCSHWRRANTRELRRVHEVDQSQPRARVRRMRASRLNRSNEVSNALQINCDANSITLYKINYQIYIIFGTFFETEDTR